VTGATAPRLEVCPESLVSRPQFSYVNAQSKAGIVAGEKFYGAIKPACTLNCVQQTSGRSDATRYQHYVIGGHDKNCTQLYDTEERMGNSFAGASRLPWDEISGG
jgi:hypothetical protein